jgi:hypothetical protein
MESNVITIVHPKGKVYIDLEKGKDLSQRILDYNWEYRKKICSKCSSIEQQRRKCFRVNNFKDGIQETHCEWQTRAGTQKFRKEINEVLDEGMRKMTLDNVGME